MFFARANLKQRSWTLKRLGLCDRDEEQAKKRIRKWSASQLWDRLGSDYWLAQGIDKEATQEMKEHARALFAGDLTPQEVPGDTFKAAMETPKHTSGAHQTPSATQRKPRCTDAGAQSARGNYVRHI